MAPKSNKGNKAAEKARLEQKKKVAEDKTFGLKNKNKSAKVQQFVNTVKKNVDDAAKRQQKGPDPKDKKKAEAERAKELAELFAVAIKQPKVPVGVDPKSVVCEYFRHGQCTKGFKCKFSHDLNVERKGGKIDIFQDRRGGEDEKEEGMDDWDQEKLEEVVKQKHGTERNRPTDIICKYFLDAVEKKMYGWFWQCPNGKDCKYRHALPPGYVLKSQMKELLEAEAANVKPIEDEIDEERRKVDAKTPITEETFARWREDRKAEAQRKREAEEADRKRKGILTGREIFMQEGFLAEDDAGAHDAYDRENDEEEEIRRMDEEAAARRAAEASAAAAAAGPGPSNGAAASSSNGAAAVSNGVTTLKLSKEEEALFMDEDDLDDDLDDEELDALEAEMSAATVH